MALRHTLLLPFALLAGASLSAQENGSAPQPSADAAPAQPPAAPAPQDPAQRAEELRQSIAKVEQELQFIREILDQGGLLARVRPYLSDRQVAGDVIELSQPADPATIQAAEEAHKESMEEEEAPKGVVRLLGDGEKERLGEDVVFTVDGIPVRKAEFDAMYEYLTSYPRPETDEQIRKLAVQALVTQKAAQAHFEESAQEAFGRIEKLKGQLENGADFAAVAKEHSQCPSAAQGGDLGSFTRGRMDPMFEKAAFSLKVGETSDVVQSAFGYHIIKVTGREKGEDPSKDTVRASHILAMYDTDSNQVRNVMQRARAGQVELAFVDSDWREYAPDHF